MVVIDANLLIYAYNTGSKFYSRVNPWLGEIFASGVEVGIPMQAILAFLRISTNPKSSEAPVNLPLALAVVSSWLARPQVHILDVQPRHWPTFVRLCEQSRANGDLLTDVHIAALAIEQNATVYSADTDFARFPGLRWVNPLENHG